MIKLKKLFFIFIISIGLSMKSVVIADNHNVTEILELIQKDLKTLEKAVYSSEQNNTVSNSVTMDQNSEEV